MTELPDIYTGHREPRPTDVPPRVEVVAGRGLFWSYFDPAHVHVGSFDGPVLTGPERERAGAG